MISTLYILCVRNENDFFSYYEYFPSMNLDIWVNRMNWNVMNEIEE